MKKYSLGVLVLGFAFVATSHVFAADVAVTCNFPDHAVFNSDGTIKVGCISSADWDKAKADQAARNGQKLPSVVPGMSVTDEGNVTLTCPSHLTQPCMDATHTDGYRTAMHSLIQQLQALQALVQFSYLNGWIGK